MKLSKYIVLFVTIVYSFFSCQHDEDISIAVLNVCNEKINPSYNSATIECRIVCNVMFENAIVECALSEDFLDPISFSMNDSTGLHAAVCTNLLEDTTYYVRYKISNHVSSMLSECVSSFTTIPYSLPAIETVSVIDIMDHSATAQIELRSNGGTPITQLGICFGIDNNPTIETAKSVVFKNNETKITLFDLQENTTYYVRAYAKNKLGIAYSKSIDFTTLTLPKVQTDDISDIQITSAILNATLLSNGNDSTVTKGFCWSENTNPTLSSSYADVNSTDILYCYQLANLKDETKYYVRAYAKNKLGVVYGAEKTFTTLEATKPVVSTSTVSDITNTSAKTGGNVISDGGAAVTDRGICYSTSDNPTISNSKISSGSGTGNFITNLAGLSDETTYYIRAYATNKKGTSYGQTISFTTSQAPYDNGYEYVDLGLSVKWATCNVGAMSPEESGDYFAWGEIQPKDVYNDENYKWAEWREDASFWILKYDCSSFGIADFKSILDKEDDAAAVKLGGAWRMPTEAEINELREQCTWEWTKQSGVLGYRVVSKINGNCIFIPAAGEYELYWSSELSVDNAFLAYQLYLGPDITHTVSMYRWFGHLIRPVLD